MIFKKSGFQSFKKLFNFIFEELLRPKNLIEFGRKILPAIQKKNLPKLLKNFQDYIRTDFLEKVQNPYCKNYTALWFKDIGNKKAWAFRSMIFKI
jgi:hypothetical protein